jgi:hypothetical protein
MTNQVKVSVYETPPEFGNDPSTFWIGENDFEKSQIKNTRRKPRSWQSEPYLIIGFDTEFKTPDYHVTREQIVGGNAKYRVLSYQFHAKNHNGEEWKSICCTQNNERISISEFLTFALGMGARNKGIKNLPSTILLVGHFTRADLPAFSDFNTNKEYFSNVRNTFISDNNYMSINLENNEGCVANLKVIIRDTMLLTPQSSKSLKQIGELVGFPKKYLDPDINKHKELIRNMDKVRIENWETYKDYAIMDATICVKYIEKIIEQYESVTGKKKVPVTLTSIGVDLLLKTWSENQNISYLNALGKEIVKEKYFNKQKNYFCVKKNEVFVEELSHAIEFITETYHGGRNEQYWFGPGEEDNWIDIDLTSAYPTAMSLIGMPDWKSIRESKKISDFTATTLGFLWVDFKFPDSTRYPTLPVRSNNGLIFPLEGTSYCSSPEIIVAKQLGCKIKIRKGVIVPTNPDIKIFGEFIKDCLEKRKQAGSKTFEGLFWKEISNSTYGKTAQGLRQKRVYDMRDRETKLLPPSKITNPCFASYITSYVRAVIGEIMNAIPANKMVFSCTTDGFITNASESEIPRLSATFLSTIYKQAREELTGDSTILEIKHSIRQPVGWRTRGQATLKQHPDLIDNDKGIILAKAGIFTKAESETTEQRNQEITDLFFNRTPSSRILVESLTGIRDIVEHDADLVSKEIDKRLSMEYDWKRQPTKTHVLEEYNHIYFETRPWQSIEQFNAMRDIWDEYTKNSPICIKTMENFHCFADYVECKGVDPEKSKYSKKKNPDIERLRSSLCSAWKHSEGGLLKDPSMSATQFANLLSSNGVPCKRTDVENAMKKPFEKNMCFATKQVRDLLRVFKKRLFPNLDISQFLIESKTRNSVTIRPLLR